ncbi:extracellular solute-binding protein [Actinomyces bowdenii]|uniref:ABC transporter substrate-binding protein n=1 Tax=Actinomyces bowdenii TaxID=131109 RepID=UPI001ABC1360|nr:extracellular solute-binding protein [Actinomyces bowdenii]MBO3723458.1 extracellular solute-binding protein [Actinomyces bowdenii]
MIITRRALGLSATAVAAAALSGCSLFSSDEESSAEESSLVLLVESSGQAETAALRDAVEAFTDKTGVAVVLQVTTELEQELSRGLAGDSPVDVFHLTPGLLAAHAQAGSLHPYGDQLAVKDDLAPALVAAATYGGVFYGAPTPAATLALFINTDLWASAGLSEADYPTTWEELEQVGTALAGGQGAGLVLGPQYSRLGAFMVQAGGGLTDAEGAITANSEGSVAGLSQVKSLLDAGAATLAPELEASSGGEAFGAGQAAMTIESTAFVGVLASQHPELGYAVVELPAGPAGQGSLQFSRVYGIAAASPRKEEALSLVEFLTSAEQQAPLAAAAGAVPSSMSAATAWSQENPGLAAFAAALPYAAGMPALAGAGDALADLDAQLAGLAGADPRAILDSAQVNLEAVTS